MRCNNRFSRHGKPPFLRPLPVLGLCTIRYSGFPSLHFLCSTHVAVHSILGCFLAVFLGKLVTPRLGSHGSEGGRQREQLPVAAAATNQKNETDEMPGSELLATGNCLQSIFVGGGMF